MFCIPSDLFNSSSFLPNSTIMTLWVDRYRPKKLSELTYHLEQACDLAELVKTEDFPHLLVYGPSGAGKRTRIHCILRELYGAGAERLRLDKKSLTTPSNRKIEIDTVSSNYHIEINPGEVGIYDRVVVQEVIKQMAQTTQIASATQKSFKVVVLMEADQLTRDAQHALRRTMEKYTMSCRLILCSESLSRIIEPLRSRCMVVRVAAPTDEEIKDVCLSVAEKVRLTVPDPVLEQIVTKSRGNLRRALLSMEAVKRKGVPIKDNEQVPEPEWEIYLRETADMMIKKQSNETVLAPTSACHFGFGVPGKVASFSLIQCGLVSAGEGTRASVRASFSLYPAQSDLRIPAPLPDQTVPAFRHPRDRRDGRPLRAPSD
ncbi:hypothetical protein Y032_0367g36 [Ancylostoma ceylanicum]|uniref:AAA+ ATPase domain-containing protein n=2 Tax=Ancylostoma ceylanicum TaxID=53326 RepID=A0A016RUX6_9BILA|nr:hypothetical protein Y032_0367g36 [Ancylostoma ceylanicum]